MKKKKVNILLATYNGSNYIGQQLESLVNQTYENIDIYVRDDCSTDNTKEIISEFINRHNDKKIFLIDSNINLGYPNCFIEILRLSEEVEYYAFCDQDDVWFNDKIDNAVKCLDKLNKKIPLLYYSSVDYYDEKLNFVRHSRFASSLHRNRADLDLQKFLLGGEPLGMTFVFNNITAKALLSADNDKRGCFKDGFIKTYAASCGEIVYDPQPSAKYRRHSGAVTGNNNPAGKINRYINGIRNTVFNKQATDMQSMTISYIYKTYGKDMTERNRILMSIFSDRTLIKQIKKIFWPKRFRVKLMDEIGYRFLFLCFRL